MSESYQEFDISDWLDPVPAMGRAETAVAPIYAPPSGMRAFPIGFHCAAPGQSTPERIVVRVKAGSAPA